MNDLIIRKKWCNSISNFSQYNESYNEKYRIIEVEADKLKRTMLTVKKIPVSIFIDDSQVHSFVNLLWIIHIGWKETLLEFSFSPVNLCPAIIQMKKLKICHVQVENKTMKNGGNMKGNKRKRKKIMNSRERTGGKKWKNEDVYIYYVRKNKMKNIRTNTHLLLLNEY